MFRLVLYQLLSDVFGWVYVNIVIHDIIYQQICFIRVFIILVDCKWRTNDTRSVTGFVKCITDKLQGLQNV